MEEIILITGCDPTKSWTNVAFLGNQVDARVTFGVKVDDLQNGTNFQFSPDHVRGAVLNEGPVGRVRLSSFGGITDPIQPNLTLPTRTYSRINVYLSGGFASLAPWG